MSKTSYLCGELSVLLAFNLQQRNQDNVSNLPALYRDKALVTLQKHSGRFRTHTDQDGEMEDLFTMQHKTTTTNMEHAICTTGEDIMFLQGVKTDKLDEMIIEVIVRFDPQTNCPFAWTC